MIAQRFRTVVVVGRLRGRRPRGDRSSTSSPVALTLPATAVRPSVKELLAEVRDRCRRIERIAEQMRRDDR